MFAGVDLRSSKICELGLLNYKAKRVFYPSERRKFRCRYDYYWASIFKVVLLSEPFCKLRFLEFWILASHSFCGWYILLEPSVPLTSSKLLFYKSSVICLKKMNCECSMFYPCGTHRCDPAKLVEKFSKNYTYPCLGGAPSRILLVNPTNITSSVRMNKFLHINKVFYHHVDINC